jgi:hypothetical protein
LSNIDSLEVNFRINYSRKLAETYYYKEDYESPGKVISQNITKNDLIISTVAPIEYYLPKLDYYFRSYTDVEFWGRSRNKGTTEIWTNTNLIFKKDQLIFLIDENKKNIWLITYSNTRPGAPELDKELAKKYIDKLFYTNRDGSLNVHYIKASQKEI